MDDLPFSPSLPKWLTVSHLFQLVPKNALSSKYHLIYNKKPEEIQNGDIIVINSSGWNTFVVVSNTEKIICFADENDKPVLDTKGWLTKGEVILKEVDMKAIMRGNSFIIIKQDDETRQKSSLRARTHIGRKWDFFGFNSEHFITDVLYQHSECIQLVSLRDHFFKSLNTSAGTALSMKMVAKEGAKIFAEEGAKKVAEEGAKIVVEEGAKIVVKEGAKIVAEKGAKIVAEKGAKIVAEEGAKIVAEEGAKIVAEEGAKIVAEEGAKIVAEKGAKIVAEKGAKIVAEEGAKIVAEKGAKIVAKEGAKTVAKEGAKKVAEEGAKTVAKEGANTVAKEAATKAIGIKAKLIQGAKCGLYPSMIIEGGYLGYKLYRGYTQMNKTEISREQFFHQGAKDIGASGGSFVGGVIGSAVGTAFIPVWGTFLGSFVGSFVGSLVGGTIGGWVNSEIANRYITGN